MQRKIALDRLEARRFVDFFLGREILLIGAEGDGDLVAPADRGADQFVMPLRVATRSPKFLLAAVGTSVVLEINFDVGERAMTVGVAHRADDRLRRFRGKFEIAAVVLPRVRAVPLEGYCPNGCHLACHHVHQRFRDRWRFDGEDYQAVGADPAELESAVSIRYGLAGERRRAMAKLSVIPIVRKLPGERRTFLRLAVHHEIGVFLIAARQSLCFRLLYPIEEALAYFPVYRHYRPTHARRPAEHPVDRRSGHGSACRASIAT